MRKNTALNLGGSFWLALLLTLVAAVLRSLDMQGRSMWPDEGITYLRIAPSLTDILRNVVYILGKPVIDTQPPAYFVLLKGWGALGGDSEFSLKWLTVLLGVLVVPLTYALGRKLFNARVGLVAALFMLLSPGVQWYAHEVRLYTAVVCVAAFSAYALYRALQMRIGQARWWLVAELAIALSMLTHYTFVGLVVGQVILAAIVVVSRWHSVPRDHRRILFITVGFSLLVIAGLLLLPDVQAAFRRLSAGREVNYSFIPLDVIFWTQVNGFLFGLNIPDPHALLLEISTWVVAVLCLLGAIAAFRRRKSLPGWLMLASLLMPILVWFAISFRKPNYQGFRHLMLILPFMAVLLGQLVSVLWQRSLLSKVVGGLVVLAIAAMQLYGLAYTFIRTPNWHDDYRGLAYYIRDHWQDGDIIVIPSAVHAATVMQYLRGFPWRHFPESAEPKAPKVPVDDAGRQRARRAFLQQYRRVWYMPLDYETGDWFMRDLFLRTYQHFPSRSFAINLQLFDIESPVTALLPASARTVQTNANGAGITLAGYRFGPAARYNPQPNTLLSLYWRRDEASVSKEILTSISTAFRLVYGNRPWWDFELPGELDNAPEAWKLGTFLRVDYALPLPLGLPQVPYELKLEAHQGSKAENFQATSHTLFADDVTCCIRIVQWPLGATEPTSTLIANPLASPLQPPPAMPQPADVMPPQRTPLSDWVTTWRGSDASLAKVEYPDEVRPGEFLPVVLTWRANQPHLSAWETEMSLEPLVGGAIATATREVGTPDFPASSWPLNEPVRDDDALQVPYTLNAGWYKLVASRYRSGAYLDSVLLGLVRVADYPPSPVPTTIQHPLQVVVGDFSLLGWSLDRAVTRNVTLNFHTYWRVDKQPDRDGVLFLHVYAPDGTVPKQPIAQDDNTPEYNKRFTLTYRPNQGIDQLHRVVLPADAPAGEYRLFAGAYDRGKECCRWPAQQNGQPAKDDLVFLGSFTLPKLPEYTFKIYVPLIAKP